MFDFDEDFFGYNELSDYFETTDFTDILFLLDVSKYSNGYLKNITKLSKDSLPCVEMLKKAENEFALVTYGETSTLEIGFNECYNQSCFDETSNRIT